MRKIRVVLCMLLAVTLPFVCCACRGKEGYERTQETAVKAESGGRDATADPISTGIYEGRNDLIVLDWEAYKARPYGIQAGTVLNYAAPNDVPSQLPWNCTNEEWLTDNIYEGLLYMYMNDPTDIRGCIAERWEHSDDYLTWTFQIRGGVRFTDGTPCDAYAVAEAWDYTFEMMPLYKKDYNIESWEARSAEELIVHMSAPCAWFEATLCGDNLSLISPTSLDVRGAYDNEAAVGTGPYYIASYRSGERIVLKANPNYYLEEKMPCIETVNFRIFKEQHDIVDALLDGSLDGATLYNRWRTIKDTSIENYRELQENGYDGDLVACLGNEDPLWFNPNQVEAFQSLEVREALVRFIDFNTVNDRVYDGLGDVQDSLWAKGSSGYVPAGQYYYDPEEGRDLLASVGMEASDISFRTFIYEWDVDLYAAIQDELGKAGVKMDVVTDMESSLMMIMYEGGVIGSYADYENTAPYLPWTRVLLPDTIKKVCWQDIYNPELYRKMLTEYDAMTKAETWDEMLVHCRQLTTYVQDDFGMIGGIQPPAFLALGKDFKNGIYFSEEHDLQLYYLYQQGGLQMKAGRW